MTAPAGAAVGIHVDLIATVAIGDMIETQTGRRYLVVAARVQQRGKHAGRQHLRCVVMSPGDTITCRRPVAVRPRNITCRMCNLTGQTCGRRFHVIRWYK